MTKSHLDKEKQKQARQLSATPNDKISTSKEEYP